MGNIDNLDDDLENIFNADDFNVPAIFTPQPSGTPEQLNVIFNAEFESVDPEGQAEISTDKPNIYIHDTAFLSAPKQDDHFLIKGILYEILEVQPDGTGVIVIFLNEI